MKQPSEQLSFWTKLAYGYGDLGTAIVATLKAFFLLFFLTDVARLHPAAAGSIILITKLWDALNDPLVGWLSDHTHTRWGRRRPWLIFGALPFGVLFFMMWIVPPFDDVGKFFYYLVVGLLMDTAYTVINVPYIALTPELTHDYDERTSLNSFRAGFSVIGSVLAAGLQPLIVGQFDDLRVGYIASAAFWAILCIIPTVVVFFVIRERPESRTGSGGATRPSLLAQIRVALANRPYRFVIAIYLCSWLALQLTATVMAFYMTYYMGRHDLLPVVLVSIQLSSFVFIFVWSALSHRLDKRLVYLIGASIWLVVQMSLFFLTPSQIGLMIPLAILLGAGVATAYLIPWSMAPDVIEFDEWETGERREGIFYGLMVFLQKTGTALAIWLVGLMLAFAGYITPSEAAPIPVQPESALFTMRLFIGPTPALILACSLVITYFYPLSRRRHAEMRVALDRRRTTSSAAHQMPAASTPTP